MAIRKLHSNNVTNNRADIAAQYDELFFDDQANSILLPDPSGLLETKIGANATAGTGIKGLAAGYVNAGTFITLDNIRATVTTTGNRGLSVASVTGTFTATISATYSLTGGSNGHSTAWPGATYTTTPSGSWFGYHFPNAGDGSTYLVNDYNNQKFYRIHLMIGPSYNNNFISIERLY
jgi:hypothetical protein